MSAIEIVYPPRERWGSVLNLALSHRPFAERMRLTEALLQPVAGRAPDAGFHGLREARQAEQTVGAALAVLQPGRTALVYQPRLTDDAPAITKAELTAALDRFLVENRVQLAQEVLALDDDGGAAYARSTGYAIEVELVYLVADAMLFPLEPPESDWRVVPFHESDQAALEALLPHTYDATLDCPEINGVRSSADTLAGYRQTGSYDPFGWRLIWRGGLLIGCVLISRHNEYMAELIYMGLAPQERAKGRASELIGWSMWLARELRCASLSVAVDARNTPAHKAYQRAGFAEFDRRRVMLRTFK